MRLGPLPLAFAAAVVLVLPAPARSDDVLDQGVFHVYLNDHLLGFENFQYQSDGDSLKVHSSVVQTPGGPASRDTLVKDALLVSSVGDFDLRQYNSSQKYLGHSLLRGLLMSDTLFSSYRQVDEHGEGDRLVRPPGRMYVLDPQVFMLYDFVCRTLYEQTFDERPVQLYWLGAMGAADTLVEATASDLGTETIRWGSRPVQTRKLRIADPEVEFLVWISPEGAMLRLTQPAYGLRVEREAPPVKRRARPRSGGG